MAAQGARLSVHWLTSPAGRKQARDVCHLVALRGASLAAAATGGLLRVMGRDGKHTAMQPTAVVVDGGLFEHYAAFRGCAALTCCRAGLVRACCCAAGAGLGSSGGLA